MHGGRSYSGYASPRLKHGRYSDDLLFRIQRQAGEAKKRSDAALNALLSARPPAPTIEEMIAAMEPISEEIVQALIDMPDLDTPCTAGHPMK